MSSKKSLINKILRERLLDDIDIVIDEQPFIVGYRLWNQKEGSE